MAEEHVRIGRRCGVNAHLKVPCLAAGMIAGADSIDDLGLAPGLRICDGAADQLPRHRPPAHRHRPGPRRPTVIITTNDTQITAKALIERYARRMTIEQRLAEIIQAFCADALSSTSTSTSFCASWPSVPVLSFLITT